MQRVRARLDGDLQRGFVLPIVVEAEAPDAIVVDERIVGLDHGPVQLVEHPRVALRQGATVHMKAALKTLEIAEHTLLLKRDKLEDRVYLAEAAQSVHKRRQHIRLLIQPVVVDGFHEHSLGDAVERQLNRLERVVHVAVVEGLLLGYTAELERILNRVLFLVQVAEANDAGVIDAELVELRLRD